MYSPRISHEFDQGFDTRARHDKDDFNVKVSDQKAKSSVNVVQDEIVQGSGNDHVASLYETAKSWPFAVLWSVVFSSTMILVSYSPAWIAQLFALPAFTTRFGFEYNGIYVVSSKWQSALSACSMVGQIIGAPSVSFLMDIYGRKPTFICFLFLTTGFIFIQFFSTSLPTLLAGTILLGVCLGSFGVLCITYAMEVSPLQLRGALGGLYSFGIVSGPVLSVVVSKGVVNMTNQWAYRIGYAVQWAWPLFLIPLSFVMPESPVWLIRNGRVAEAEESLIRLATKGYNVGPDLVRITQIDHQEQRLEQSTNFKDIFKRSDLRRTIIATFCYSTIIITGNSLAGSSAYFLILAGIDASTAFFWSLGGNIGALAGAFLSLWILANCRRRPTYVWAQLIGAILLVTMGFIQLDHDYYQKHDAAYAQAAIMVAWNIVYGAAIGPISTVIMGEVPSNALRSKTVAFASIIQITLVLLTLVIQPYLLNPESLHLQGYIGFIAGASGFVCTAWVYFYVPETSLPAEKLDQLFASGVGARHFTTYQIAEAQSC